MVFTLGPVEALARDAMAIQSQATEPFDTTRRDNEGLSVSLREAVAEYRLGNSDAQAAGEMVVAAAREANTLHRSIGRSATHGLPGADGVQLLEQIAQSHRRCQIPRRHRGHRSAGKTAPPDRPSI
jgi:hypothetical protein